MAYRDLPDFYPQPCVAAHQVICFLHLFAPFTPRLLFQGQVRVIDMNHQMYGAVLTVDNSLTRLIDGDWVYFIGWPDNTLNKRGWIFNKSHTTFVHAQLEPVERRK
ncbi:uncharacterized protein ARMOST_09808 [Armillaria ostoyae]|uniref:Uncharacterized protein n=1 Tax=Armillaria ostoyae TaxID=47428 RepID=A0A284RCI1_ARMOS|nr:uncharacterized protein ARMOST_09808 [Armillaria ostoyae]